MKKLDLSEANEIAKRIVLTTAVRQTQQRKDFRAEHAKRISRDVEEMRLFPKAAFHVIETATGKAIGDGKPMPISIATWYRSARDCFNKGDFFIQPANEQGAALLAWRAAA